ncbi:hypothetical protein EV127DRAFT_133169 [Xylaria flabelliformis]|nr:hypothetical protein EV127DRAFT_133169 [Xylaria flabelliformis]
MPESKEPVIAQSFISHLRQAARFCCPLTGCNDSFPRIDDRIRDHLQSKHCHLWEGKDHDSIIRELKRGRIPPSLQEEQSSTNLSPSIIDVGSTKDRTSVSNKRRSPITVTSHTRARSDSPVRRSRAWPSLNIAGEDRDFLKRGPQHGKLWDPDQGSSPHPKPSSRSSKPQTQQRRASPPPPSVKDDDEDDEIPRLIKQPETRPISQEQLVAEVKGIYAGLVMVESKCIEVDNAQSSQNDTKLNNEQWQALIALHRMLLHEHHDFFLAAQHPSASQALRRLASKYAMPARMWRHGIHSFLELLRHRLPASLEHMLTFIYLAYSMMALLYETVPAFEDTWIECLGDLGRYRMAIEDEDIRDREVWTSVSRHWYSQASDKAPTTGRLYHHLATLARPDALQQLFYYAKSLSVSIPFESARESARESVMTLCEPIHPYDGGREDPTRFKHSKYRRGRGARRNNAYWKQRNDEQDTNLFDDRELLFQDEHGSLKASRLANLDTQLKIQKHAGDDLVMSAHCARDLGLFDRLSTDFDDPCLQSISGHSTAVLGVLRNVQFRLKGSSVTFRRDFWVCESLNNIVDVMIGANFIKDNFKMLFEKVKDCVSSFATWFSKKKETPEQKKEREERERQQQIAIKELEIKRLQKESEALRRATSQNSGRQHGGEQGGSQSNGS